MQFLLNKKIVRPADLPFGHGNGENPEARPADEEARDLSEQIQSDASRAKQHDNICEGGKSRSASCGRRSEGFE